jgi:hypothetical protein
MPHSEEVGGVLEESEKAVNLVDATRYGAEKHSVGVHGMRRFWLYIHSAPCCNSSNGQLLCVCRTPQV